MIIPYGGADQRFGAYREAYRYQAPATLSVLPDPAPVSAYRSTVLETDSGEKIDGSLQVRGREIVTIGLTDAATAADTAR